MFKNDNFLQERFFCCLGKKKKIARDYIPMYEDLLVYLATDSQFWMCKPTTGLNGLGVLFGQLTFVSGVGFCGPTLAPYDLDCNNFVEGKCYLTYIWSNIFTLESYVLFFCSCNSINKYFQKRVLSRPPILKIYMSCLVACPCRSYIF